MKEGFLGSAAPLAADLVLLLEIGMGVGLIIGGAPGRHWTFSASRPLPIRNRASQPRGDRLTTSSSFRLHLLPAIPAKLARAYYGLGATRAALGSVTEGAALYILLAAGTNVLPERLRISKHKIWMRSALVLWWIVLLLSFATYIRWCVPHLLCR